MFLVSFSALLLNCIPKLSKHVPKTVFYGFFKVTHEPLIIERLKMMFVAYNGRYRHCCRSEIPFSFVCASFGPFVIEFLEIYVSIPPFKHHQITQCCPQNGRTKALFGIPILCSGDLNLFAVKWTHASNRSYKQRNDQ